MPQSNDIQNELAALLRKAIKKDQFDPTLDLVFSSLHGWDSIKMLAYLVQIEKTFQIQFQARDVANFKSFGDLVHFVTAKKLA